jgi:hypothetical protein
MQQYSGQLNQSQNYGQELHNLRMRGDENSVNEVEDHYARTIEHHNNS